MKKDRRASLPISLFIGFAGLVIIAADNAAGGYNSACLQCHTDMAWKDKSDAQEGNSAGGSAG